MASKPVLQNFKDGIHSLWTSDIDNNTNVNCVYMFYAMPIPTGLTILTANKCHRSVPLPYVNKEKEQNKLANRKIH